MVVAITTLMLLKVGLIVITRVVTVLVAIKIENRNSMKIVVVKKIIILILIVIKFLVVTTEGILKISI